MKVTRLRPAKRMLDAHGRSRERWNKVNITHDVAITSDSCGKIRELGFAASTHINMYGERFEIISDPFDDGDCIAVRATSGNDPAIRTLRLPIAILVGREDRFLKRREVRATIKL
jgi:hypothetical protein